MNNTVAAEIDLADLLPPLSTEEFEALRSDIQQHGVQHSVFVDENGEVLDGRNRLKIDPDAPRKVITGLSPAEKQAFVFRSNFVRRNLSPDQKRAAMQKMKGVAFALRAEDPKKWTQKAVAGSLGVAQQTIADWLKAATERKQETTTNTGSGNGCENSKTPDARVKVSWAAKRVITERIEQGSSQAQVAADFGITQQAVSRIATKERKQAESTKQRAEAARAIEGDCGVVEGDFRIGGAAIADESVDLIFTDPPYLAEDMPIYHDLAVFAERVLRPGGWLLAYVGVAHFPLALDAIRVEGLSYGWVFCVNHSGGDGSWWDLRLRSGWKPIIAMFKPPRTVTWDWFRDVVSGGKEEDLHEWQKPESEARYFIDRLSSPDGFVCDPFAGSGTTLAAAKNAGRRWLGFEINPEHVQNARVRVAGGAI
jgi:site-specific DNA-methyltransferase (adenine-specific)